MANLWDMCTLQLLCVVFTPCLSEIFSADVRSVHPGENITLPCDITNYYKIAWYRLRSGKVTLLIAAGQQPLKKTYAVAYNVDKIHFVETESSSSSVSLVIIGVRETDLGFYYCTGGEKKVETPSEIGNVIRLDFTGISPAPKNDMDIDHQHQDTLPSTGAEFWISVCVCPVSILINLILICVFCCIFKGKSLSSCIYSTKAVASNEKEENIQYASVQYTRGSKATAKKNTPLESVIYATVVPKSQRN